MKTIDQSDLDWCRRVAAGVCREFGLSVGRAGDDLAGAGTVGLMIAAARFDPAASDLTFRHYAWRDVRKRCIAEAVRIARCGMVGNDAPEVRSIQDSLENFHVVDDSSVWDTKEHLVDRAVPLAMSPTSDLRD